MIKRFFSRIKLLVVFCAVCLCGLVGGVFAWNAKTENVSAAETGNITQIQFRMNGEGTQSFFFLRMADQTDYTTGNQFQEASWIYNTNILDKVTVYFTTGNASLRDVWEGSVVFTYLFGDNHTLAFLMKDGYEAKNGVGARIEEGAEIPLLSGEKLVTATVRTFWVANPGPNEATSQYIDGYETIETSLSKVHIRAGNETLADLQFLFGLGEGNDWEGKGNGYPTQVKGADGTNSHAGLGHWYKMLTANFLSKIKFHVQATDTWVTLGEAISYTDSNRGASYVFNHWGEAGGTLNVVLNKAYHASAVDKVLFEAGCELPTYYTIGHDDIYRVHVLDAQYVWTNPDMSKNYWGIFASPEKKYQVTFNGKNPVLLDTSGVTVDYPADLSETKEGDEYGTYVYNWYLNGELYDFSQPVKGNINLTSDGTFTLIPKNYNITYYAADGETVWTQGVCAYGEAMGALAEFPPVEAQYIPYWTIDGEAITSETIWTYTEDKVATLAYNLREYTVTFDGENATKYIYGNVIEKPADPTKESSVEFDFTFEGWYDGDKKWDFETDTLQKTTNLVSKYTETKRKYTVSFHVTGREDITIDPVQVEYGDNCELTRLFDETLTEGYLYSVTVNGVEKATVKVLSDITVEVTFTEAPALEEPAKTDSGCGGSIGGVSVVLVGVAAMCLTVFKKKEEN